MANEVKNPAHEKAKDEFIALCLAERRKYEEGKPFMELYGKRTEECSALARINDALARLMFALEKQL